MQPLAPVLRPPPRLDSRALAILAAILVHLALLGPLVWSTVSDAELSRVEYLSDYGVVPLQLTRPLLPGERQRPARDTERDEPIPMPPTARSPRLAAAPTPSPDALPATATPIATGAPPVEDRWRLGGTAAARAPWGGDVCRDLSNLRAWEAANCREHGPVQRAAATGSPPAEIARPAPRPGRAPGQTGQDEFARQAEANEAWRDYTRGDGGYPGLRSLAKHY